MGYILRIDRPDSVVTVGLHWYTVEWDQGRLLGGGPVFGTSDLSHFQLDLRYWEIVPVDDAVFGCTPRKEKNVLLLVKDGEQVVSHEAFGYETFTKEKQIAYAVFLKDGSTKLLSSSDYEFHFQDIQDHTRGRSVTTMIAIRKAS